MVNYTSNQYVYKGNIYNYVIKLEGEIQNRFKLISEERVNIFKQNSKNLMKIG